MLPTCASCLENIIAEAKITFWLPVGILLLLIVCQNLICFYSAYGRGSATSRCIEMAVFEHGMTAHAFFLTGREISQRLSRVTPLSPFFPYLLAPALSQKGSLQASQGSTSEAVKQPACRSGQAGREWF